ncbi:subtilase-type protease inhibitor [Peterkaempfera bronchialis]|uniref:Subtilisin inhibitor domain-containing protein n=1 Tax=Peterkaempfera bronchialis TaxID=2126346 RepID=A0A345T497_9ACTN|nr:SSI family serine proteinase inhibitor [Peterkaempfera bronchialis]AXI80802.1 hypothetical protein C7M71_028905 [Peterkaempfera bronchialis]
MRNRLRTTLITAAGLLAATTGLASAAPAGLYPPSALVLTLSPGGGTDPDASVARAVTLSCAPTPSGTHPAPEQACALLARSGGSFAALRGRQRRCPATADPVTVTAEGVWRGRQVSYRGSFANRCVLLAARGPVFDF